MIRPRVLDDVAAWMLALLWVAPLALCDLDGVPSPEHSRPFSLLAPLTLENFARPGTPRHSRSYFLNTMLLVTMILVCAAGALHAGGLRLRPVRLPRIGLAVHAGARAAHDHARRAAGRELPTIGALGLLDTIARPSACPIWRRPSASSCCARPSRPCPRNSRRPRGRRGGLLQMLWRVYVPWRGRSTSPTAWSRSATTGTTSCGR